MPVTRSMRGDKPFGWKKDPDPTDTDTEDEMPPPPPPAKTKTRSRSAKSKQTSKASNVQEMEVEVPPPESPPIPSASTRTARATRSKSRTKPRSKSAAPPPRSVMPPPPPPEQEPEKVSKKEEKIVEEVPKKKKKLAEEVEESEGKLTEKKKTKKKGKTKRHEKVEEEKEKEKGDPTTTALEPEPDSGKINKPSAEPIVSEPAKPSESSSPSPTEKKRKIVEEGEGKKEKTEKIVEEVPPKKKTKKKGKTKRPHKKVEERDLVTTAPEPEPESDKINKPLAEPKVSEPAKPIKSSSSSPTEKKQKTSLLFPGKNVDAPESKTTLQKIAPAPPAKITHDIFEESVTETPFENGNVAAPIANHPMQLAIPATTPKHSDTTENTQSSSQSAGTVIEASSNGKSAVVEEKRSATSPLDRTFVLEETKLSPNAEFTPELVSTPKANPKRNETPKSSVVGIGNQTITYERDNSKIDDDEESPVDMNSTYVLLSANDQQKQKTPTLLNVTVCLKKFDQDEIVEPKPTPIFPPTSNPFVGNNSAASRTFVIESPDLDIAFLGDDEVAAWVERPGKAGEKVKSGTSKHASKDNESKKDTSSSSSCWSSLKSAISQPCLLGSSKKTVGSSKASTYGSTGKLHELHKSRPLDEAEKRKKELFQLKLQNQKKKLDQWQMKTEKNKLDQERKKRGKERSFLKACPLFFE